jgi:hypothetical protein
MAAQWHHTDIPRMIGKSLPPLAAPPIPIVGNSPGVYLLFRGEDVVYVGQSWNCLLAVAEHTRKEQPKDFDRWSFFHEPDEASRRAQVKALVIQFAPEYNRR